MYYVLCIVLLSMCKSSTTHICVLSAAKGFIARIIVSRIHVEFRILNKFFHVRNTS